MTSKQGGKGQQQVRLALNMALFLILVWGAVTALFYVAGGVREREAIADAAYASLQLFFVNVGYESFPQDPGGPWGWLLVAARYVVPWMIPVLAVLAFVDALRVRLVLWLRRRFRFLSCDDRPLVLIVGLGVKGLAMVHAERGRSSGTHIVVLERDPGNPAIPAAKAAGAIVWIGDADSESDMTICCWKRPGRIFAMTGSDQHNLLVVKIARKLFKVGDSRVEVFALIQDIQERRNASSMEIFNEDTEKFWTHLMDYEEDIAAYSLFKYPVLPVGRSAPRVLVVGGGRLGYALSVELLKQGHFMCRDGRMPFPRFVVVDKSVDEIARFEGLKKILAYADHNDIGFAELQTEIADVNGWTFDDYAALRGKMKFTHVFVALGSEVRNFTIARKLAAWEKLARGNSSEAQVLAYSYEDWRAEPEGASSTTEQERPFEVFPLNEVYSEDALQWRDELREIARRIDGCYKKINEKVEGLKVEEGISASSMNENWAFDALKIDEAAGSWGGTGKRDRDASLDLAKHLFIKTKDKPTLRDFLENQAETEHRRWNAAKLLDGYVLNKVVKGGEKNKTLTHPNLVPFTDLDDRIRCYDYALMYNILVLLPVSEGANQAIDNSS